MNKKIKKILKTVHKDDIKIASFGSSIQLLSLHYDYQALVRQGRALAQEKLFELRKKDNEAVLCEFDFSLSLTSRSKKCE